MFSGDDLAQARTWRGPSFHSSYSTQSNPAVEERLRLLQDLRGNEGLSSHPAWQAELQSLSVETDPLCFDRGLLALAARMTEGGRTDLAVRVWEGMKSLNKPSEALSLASRDLATALGTGTFGSHFETLLKKFCSETLDPATLAGFALGGLAYRYGKMFAGARLFSKFSGSGTLPAWGLRGLASFFGFAMEVPAFVMGDRAATKLLGREGFGASASLPRELASVALLLGPMKVFAGSSGWLASRWGLTSGFSSEALQQSAALLGIFAGHGLERAAGLKSTPSGGSEWLEALATLLQARTAGGLIDAYSGTRGSLREAEWQLRWQNAGPRNSGQGKFLGGNGQFAWAGVFPPTSVDGSAPKGEVLLSQMQGAGAGGGRKVIGFDRGALAWGGESALNWLLELRKNFEETKEGVPASEFQLWWIPESPIDTVLLNDYGVAFRREARRFDRVNLPARISIRALQPLPVPGEVFVHSVDLSEGLGKVLKRWTERDHDGLRDLINAEWLDLQFLTYCRGKSGFLEKIRENGKDYLLFEEGKRHILPPNLTIYPQAEDLQWKRAKAAISHFANQYWSSTPTEAAQVFGTELGARLPPGAVINYFLHPQVLMLPTWGVAQGMGESAQFFFSQGSRSWMARIAGGILQDVTAQVPAERLAFLRQLSVLRPAVPKEEAGEATQSQPVPASGQEFPTERYPSENYPEAVFVDQTMPYTSLYPQTTAVSSEAADMEAKRLALGPTQPLVIADSAAARQDPRLPYEDTAQMGPEEMAKVRDFAQKSPRYRLRRAWEGLRSQVRQVWFNAQFLWNGIKLGFYEWTGRQAPPQLILKIRELRGKIQGKDGR